MVSLADLEEQLYDETGIGVTLRNRIKGGGFLGYNHGDGAIEVLSPAAMSRVEGVSDPMAAIRYASWHEEGHNRVSDENPEEHAEMDVGVINRLAGVGDYAAVREAINLHRARARNAGGKDRKFSEYALALLAGENMDGGDEYGALTQIYGGGLAGGEEDRGIVSGALHRLYNYLMKTYPEYYAPLSKPVENARGWVVNGIKGLIFSGIANIAGSGFIHEIADGAAKTYSNTAKEFLRKASPIIRTFVVGYGSGKSDIGWIWVYNKGGKRYPVFFSKFGPGNQPATPPTQAKLDDGITFVDANNESPFNHMETAFSNNLISNNFIKYGAEKYTGGCYKEWFEYEPEKSHRWFVKGDTKGGNIWKDDPTAQFYGYGGVITVHKKDVKRSGMLYGIAKFFGDDRPKSWPMIWANIKGDFAQDVAYVGLGGAFMASFLKRIGVEEPGIRQAMETYFKIGSGIEGSLGMDHPFDYE